MIDYEQLVQDVIDGTESPSKAKEILFKELVRINNCIEEVQPLVDNQNKQNENTRR